MATTYSDVFYRRYVTNGTAITALALNGNASVPALTVTAGSIYANTSSANIANVNASNVYVTGNATVTQIITAANLNATANIYTTGPITTAGNFTAPYVNSANAQHAFGMNAANILSTGTAILTYLGGNGGQINLDTGVITNTNSKRHPSCSVVFVYRQPWHGHVLQCDQSTQLVCSRHTSGPTLLI